MSFPRGAIFAPGQTAGSNETELSTSRLSRTRHSHAASAIVKRHLVVLVVVSLALLELRPERPLISVPSSLTRT